MIRLHKLAEPAILIENGAQWLETLQDRYAANEEPTTYEKSRYRHPQIKERLTEETHGKCAYCESFLLHIAYGDVEHVIPKSTDIKQTFRWDNLTLACDVCNTNKGNGSDLIDPYNDDPTKHFRFLGPMVVAREESNKAVITQKRIKLNRTDLMGRRSQRIEGVAIQLLLIKNAQDEALKKTLVDDLLANETADSSEFAAVVRSFLGVVAEEMPELNLA